MNRQEENEIYRQNMIIVQRGKMSDERCKASIFCRRGQKYIIFTGADTRISTFYTACCDKHLVKKINDANDFCMKEIKRMRDKIRVQEIESAKKILGVK